MERVKYFCQKIERLYFLKNEKDQGHGFNGQVLDEVNLVYSTLRLSAEGLFLQ